VDYECEGRSAALFTSDKSLLHLKIPRGEKKCVKFMENYFLVAICQKLGQMEKTRRAWKWE
jgi:hypothetical protein